MCVGWWYRIGAARVVYYIQTEQMLHDIDTPHDDDNVELSDATLCGSALTKGTILVEATTIA